MTIIKTQHPAESY